jgi:hypothetical protein
MSLLSTMASLSNLVQGIAPAFEDIGKTAIRAFESIKTFVNDNVVTPILEKWENLKLWWDEFKENVMARWQEIKDGVMEKVNGIFALFTGFELPTIFTKEYWTGLFDGFSIDWAGIFALVIPEPLQLVFDFITGSGAFASFSIKDRIDLAIGALPEPLSTIVNLLSGVANFGITKVGDFFDFAMNVGGTVIGWLMDFIADPTGTLAATGESITNFFSNLATQFGDLMKAPLNLIIEGWNAVVGSLNFSKTFDLGPFGEQTVGMDLSSWTIPALAKGGIVNSPTLALIGEAGPEAVVPLTGDNAPGGNQTYNITVNAGGITDRTDKRQLAREIGNMIQQELARNLGGTTMRGRY